MPLKDMRLKDSEREHDAVVGPEDKPKFPFGLTLHLDESSIKKLELEHMPEVGDVMTVIANVNVEEVGVRETQDGGVNRNINLQVTEMTLEPKVRKDILKELYGE